VIGIQGNQDGCVADEESVVGLPVSKRRSDRILALGKVAAEKWRPVIVLNEGKDCVCVCV